MSISRFRDLMEGTGCRFVVGLIVVGFIGGSVLMMFPNLNQNQNPANNVMAGPTVAKVGGRPVTTVQFGNFVQRSESQALEQMAQMAQPGQPPMPLDINTKARLRLNAASEVVRGQLLLDLAKQAKIDVSDDAIKKALPGQLEDSIKQIREQWTAMGRLKPDASEADFEAEVKKESGGRSLAQIREENLKNFETGLVDPLRREQLVQQYLNTALLKYYESQVDASEAATRKSKEARNMKRILLDASKNPNLDIAKRLREIRQEILDKKITFEEAMNKYSNETAEPKKKVSDNSFLLDGVTAAVDKTFAPVLGLKAGEISEPVFEGPNGSIFKLVKTESQLPPDFDKNKARYMREFGQTLAVSRMNEEIDKLLKQPGYVVFEEKGWGVLYDLSLLVQDREFQSKPAAERTSKLQEMFQRAKQAYETDPMSRETGAYAMQNLVFLMTFAGVPQDQVAKARIESAEAILNFSEDLPLRLEVAKAADQAKDAARANQNLAKAAQNLVAMADNPMGQALYSEINSLAMKWEQEKKLTPELMKEIQSGLQAWRQAKIDFDKRQAEARKQEEALRKQAEQAAKEVQKQTTGGSGTSSAAPAPPAAPAPGSGN